MATKSFSSEFFSDSNRPDHERFPNLFRQGPMADRHRATRVVPMRVLVFGLMRTGTSSIRVALSRLGFDDVYHMTCVFRDPDDAQWWLRAGEAKWNNKGTFTRQDWDRLLGHCQAVCDLPPAAFAEELIAAYPEAKVVILNRDVDRWYASMTKTILPFVKPSLWSMLLEFIDWRETGQVRKMVGQEIRGLFGPGGLNEDNMKRCFIEYHEKLRTILPKEKVLEYKVQDGYRPLCEFLGVPVPTREVDGKEGEEPFPRINEGSTFVDYINVRKRLQKRRVLKKIGTFVGIAAVAGAAVWYLLKG